MEPSGPLPLVVGVTGHMDVCPEHSGKLRPAIADALRQLSGPQNLPLVILTGLAQGVDRLVADVALELGHAIVAALPMPKTYYEEEFIRLGQGQKSVDEFRTLLGRVRNSYVVQAEEGVEESGYATLGREIARASQIVLALWDGGSDRAVGGTGWVVDERLGRQGGGTIPGGPPTGAVYQIVAHRAGNCGDFAGTFVTKWLKPEKLGAGDNSLEDLHKHVGAYIDQFNRDASREATIKESDVEELYVIADRLAVKYRKRTNGAWGGVYTLVLFAALWFTLFAHTPDHYVGWLWTYFFFLGAAWLVYRVARWKKWESRGQDYRALCEGLRISSVWRLLPGSAFVSSTYLARQADETRWIRHALGAIERSSRTKPKPSPEAGVTSTICSWIRPELEYYEAALHKVHRWETFLEWASRLTAIASALIAINLGMMSSQGHAHEEEFEILLVWSATLAIAAALSHNLIEKRALREHARRYKRMHRLMEDTLGRLEASPGLATPEALQLLHAVSEEALNESAEWLQTHRDRPLEIPHAG